MYLCRGTETRNEVEFLCFLILLFERMRLRVGFFLDSSWKNLRKGGRRMKESSAQLEKWGNGMFKGWSCRRDV